MAGTLESFITLRAQAQALPRAAMVNALASIATLKQRAVGIMDDARDTQINEPDEGNRQLAEAEIQAWSSLARQLESVSRELAAAIKGIDQITKTEAALKARFNIP